jgi:hypothetical protein
MMYASPIISAQVQPLTSQNVEQLPDSSVPSTLQRDDLPAFVKQAILVHFMN